MELHGESPSESKERKSEMQKRGNAKIKAERRARGVM